MTNNAKIAAYFNIEPIDFATDSGFFVLLDALRAEAYDVEISVSRDGTQVEIWQWAGAFPDLWVVIDDTDDLKTALIAATLEFIKKEAK